MSGIDLHSTYNSRCCKANVFMTAFYNTVTFFGVNINNTGNVYTTYVALLIQHLSLI